MENPTHTRRRSRFLVLEREVQEPTLTTVADVLFWSYANLAMAERAVHDKSADYQKLHFIIRNRHWCGLRRGTMHPIFEILASARGTQCAKLKMSCRMKFRIGTAHKDEILEIIGGNCR